LTIVGEELANNYGAPYATLTVCAFVSSAG
jgi:hypothetical protein